MLQTNLATRRTFVRLRANPDKPEALSGLGLFVLHLFSKPLIKMAVKNQSFFTAIFIISLIASDSESELVCVLQYILKHQFL